MNNVIIRTILPDDNPVIASIIRDSLSEFGADKQGTVFYDDSTDHLFELFQKKGAIYYMADLDGEIAGGAGIYPSGGLPDDVCELVKMYLRKQARGIGLGKKLINQCIEFARSNSYTRIYLETMPELKKALKVYESFGFTYLPSAMGNTGHFGCDVWMIKLL